MSSRRASGIVWSVISGTSSIVLPFLVFTLLTRMMTREDLAPIMVAVSALELVKAAGPQGFYEVLLGVEDRDRSVHRAAALVLLGSSLALTAIYAFLMLAILDRFASIPLSFVVLLGSKLVLDYAVIQPQAILVRRLAFRRLGLRGVVAGVISGLGALLVAQVAAPTTALAVYYALQSAFVFAMTVIGTDSLRAPRYDRAALELLWQQGFKASAVRFTAASNNYLDQLVMSLVALPREVGTYNIAKRIELVPITLGTTLGQMLFQPLFAQAAPHENRQHVARGVATVTLVCGVPIAVLALYHGTIVPLVFGPQWAQASLFVALLGISGFARALGSVHGAYLSVSGKNGRLLAYGVASGALNLIAIALFANDDLLLCVALIAAKNVAMIPVVAYLTRHTGAKAARIYLMNCAVPLILASGAALLAAEGVKVLVPPATAIGQFIFLGAAGISAALVGFAWLRRRL